MALRPNPPFPGLLLLVAVAGTTPDTLLPQAGPSILSAGGYHAVRVNSGRVNGIGDGTYGQLGSKPTGVPATVVGLTGITQVAAGGFSTLALGPGGIVWFLGESTLQHTTPHGTPDPVVTPVKVASLSGIDALAAGSRHFLALDRDTGGLFAWGHNGSGQVGNGNRLDAGSPVMVLTNVTSIAAGDGFSLAIKSDRTVWSWGRNRHGQLGLGDTRDRPIPSRVPGVSTAVAVAAGGQHSLILLAGGTVLATGSNAHGQLGLGTTKSRTSPALVAGLGNVTGIAAGHHHSGVVDSSGGVFLWGRNFEGQCGGGTTSATGYLSPRAVKLSVAVASLTCGRHFTLLAATDGSTWGTGSNSDGQLDGVSVAGPDNSQYVLTPQPVPLTPTIRASVKKVGVGCIAGSSPPVLTAGPPVVGRKTFFAVYWAPPSAPCVTLLGRPDPGKNVGHGCRFYVDLTTPAVALQGTTDGSGLWISPSFPVPRSLVGLVIGLQSAVFHPATPPFGHALSGGLVLTCGY